jgi:hypothetical protein
MTSALNAGPNVVTINVDSYDGREHGEAVLNEVRHFLSGSSRSPRRPCSTW